VNPFFRKVIWLAVFAASAGGIYYAVTVESTQKQAAAKRFGADRDAPVPVYAATVKLADVPVYLEGVGSARARNSVVVRAQVDGKILSLKFKDGQDVKKGDVLAEIDPATYKAQLDQAVAKKALADAQLANAKRDLDRYMRIPGVIAEKTVDTQRAQVVQFEAQSKAEDANIANLRAVLAYTAVIAPIDGRTGIRMIDEGNLARASDSGIVVINEIRPIVIQFTVPQQQLAAINQALAKGPVAADALDADGKTIIDRGMVLAVDNLVDQTTGTVKIKAEFPNASLQLWPGQFANARILVETLGQVVTVPTPAIQRGPSGTVAYVIGADDRVTIKPLVVRQQTASEAVIASGLAAGDRVVTTGFARLTEGSRVIVGTPGEVRPALPSGRGAGDGQGKGQGKGSDTKGKRDWQGANKDPSQKPTSEPTKDPNKGASNATSNTSTEPAGVIGVVTPAAAAVPPSAVHSPVASTAAAAATPPIDPAVDPTEGGRKRRGAAGHTAHNPETKSDTQATR
jgi:membrane fusion protein, multidrug efflux system